MIKCYENSWLSLFCNRLFWQARNPVMPVVNMMDNVRFVSLSTCEVALIVYNIGVLVCAKKGLWDIGYYSMCW